MFAPAHNYIDPFEIEDNLIEYDGSIYDHCDPDLDIEDLPF